MNSEDVIANHWMVFYTPYKVPVSGNVDFMAMSSNVWETVALPHRRCVSETDPRRGKPPPWVVSLQNEISDERTNQS